MTTQKSVTFSFSDTGRKVNIDHTWPTILGRVRPTNRFPPHPTCRVRLLRSTWVTRAGGG